MELVQAYEVLSDEKARERYDFNTVNEKSFQKFNWTPSADFANFYSYENLKREYNENKVSGGMWEISEKANAGLWKATFILLGSLGLISVFIILKIY
jgi:DnaJ-class molecular chaperone